MERLAARIGAPAGHLPTYGQSEDGARPHVEIDVYGRFAYVVVERGAELSRRDTEELDELLGWIFQDVTFAMACDYEARHRVEGEDFRRLLFTYQFELLDQLNPVWTERRKAALGQILEDVGLA